MTESQEIAKHDEMVDLLKQQNEKIIHEKSSCIRNLTQKTEEQLQILAEKYNPDLINLSDVILAYGRPKAKEKIHSKLQELNVSREDIEDLDRTIDEYYTAYDIFKNLYRQIQDEYLKKSKEDFRNLSDEEKEINEMILYSLFFRDRMALINIITKSPNSSAVIKILRILKKDGWLFVLAGKPACSRNLKMLYLSDKIALFNYHEISHTILICSDLIKLLDGELQEIIVFLSQRPYVYESYLHECPELFEEPLNKTPERFFHEFFAEYFSKFLFNYDINNPDSINHLSVGYYEDRFGDREKLNKIMLKIYNKINNADIIK